MQDNSILTVSSPFRFKTLFTKPLKYVIQIFTADATEHIATHSKGFVMNISGVNFRKMTFDDWMAEYAINGAKIHAYSPPENLIRGWQENKMEWFDNDCQGLQYDVIYSLTSCLDEIYWIRNILKKFGYKPKGKFCSQLSYDRLVAGEIFPEQDDKVSPAELKQTLLKAGWKVRRVN